MQGNSRWVEALETKFSAEYQKAKTLPWVSLESGRIAGNVRSAGNGAFGAGNVTFVEVFEAGHMAPYDQPEASLVRFFIQLIPAFL